MHAHMYALTTNAEEASFPVHGSHKRNGMQEAWSGSDSEVKV